MLPACSCVCDRPDKQKKGTKKSEFDKGKTNRRAISTVNGCLVADKLSFLSLEVRSCDIVHVTAVEAKIVYVQPTMYRPEVSRSAQSRSHKMAYTYRTRAQIPQLRARQSTNSALRQESNRRARARTCWASAHACAEHALLYTLVFSPSLPFSLILQLPNSCVLCVCVCVTNIHNTGDED